MKTLAHHILDIAENSVRARAKLINIEVLESGKENTLIISIKDDGCGMPAEMLEKVRDPFFTSRTTRNVGMGIPLLKYHAELCNGFLEIDSEEGKGTVLRAGFDLDHVDRQPEGDIGGVIAQLICSNESINVSFKYVHDEKTFEISSTELKTVLGEMPLASPPIIAYLKEMINENIHELKL